MFRRPNNLVRVIMVSATLGVIASVHAMPRSDEVAAYLERLELRQLLATHLEDALTRAEKADEREEIVVQLVELYTELLGSVTEPKNRLELEARGRRLLDDAPANKADELRLALIRGSYRAFETIAEDHRLRLATEDEVIRARGLVKDVLPELAPVRQRLSDALDTTERRLNRASDREAIVLQDQADRLRGLESQATFLYAWSLYYDAWLSSDVATAREAETVFAELLEIEGRFPEPSDISVDLREVEAYARTVLGMALSRSMTQGPAAADAWLTLLEHPQTVDVLRSQVHAWRTAILMDHDEFRAALNVLDDYIETTGTPSVAWLRLLAVNGLESPEIAAASTLAQRAVSLLASEGELDLILDLAQRYGVEALGDRGFAARYVRGVIIYDETRTEHDGDLPTLNRSLIDGYERAATEFAAAPAASDAEKYPAAAATCCNLEAWCRYFQGRYFIARTRFEDASALLPYEEAAESLWMAIVCLDKLVRAGDDPELNAELVALIDVYLAKFPASEFAPRLVLRKTATMERPTLAEVDALLEIPQNSDMYVTARSRAAQILFTLFSGADERDREAIASQFLSIAQGLMLIDETAVLTGDEDARKRYVRLSRQALEIALARDVRRLGAARSVLDGIEMFSAEGHLDLAEHVDEFDYRRVQEHLFADSTAAADRIASEMWERDPNSAWAERAASLLFDDSYRRWKDSRLRGVYDEVLAAYVVTHGPRALATYEDDNASLALPRVLGWHAGLAEVMLATFAKQDDESLGVAALALYERLITIQPGNATFLRSIAVLAEQMGDTDRALEQWRRLLAGLPRDGDRWFEARYHSLKLLARSNQALARDVMAQHRQLHPAYGPNPWGVRLRELDRSLQAAEATAPSTESESNEGGTS